MKTITGAVEGDLSVSEHLILRGMVTGIITVKQGGSLDLHGMCGKSLIVNAGGKPQGPDTKSRKQPHAKYDLQGIEWVIRGDHGAGKRCG